jgi:hypothetical protein
MIKINDLNACFYESLIGFFESNGFKFLKRSKCFSKKNDVVEQIFNLNTYQKKTHIEIKPEILIKIKDIEDIYRKCSSIPGRPYCTLGNNLFKLLDNNTDFDIRGNWIVKDNNNLDYLIKIIPEYASEVIFPYFDKNSSIKRVDELLNTTPETQSIHNELYPLRANIGIIAAKLNKNKLLNYLIKVYESRILNAEETYKQEFFEIKKIILSDHVIK